MRSLTTFIVLTACLALPSVSLGQNDFFGVLLQFRARIDTNENSSPSVQIEAAGLDIINFFDSEYFHPVVTGPDGTEYSQVGVRIDIPFESLLDLQQKTVGDWFIDGSLGFTLQSFDESDFSDLPLLVNEQFRVGAQDFTLVGPPTETLDRFGALPSGTLSENVTGTFDRGAGDASVFGNSISRPGNVNSITFSQEVDFRLIDLALPGVVRGDLFAAHDRDELVTNMAPDIFFFAGTDFFVRGAFEREVIGAPLLGDVNLDGVVDFLDISPFIAVLAAGGIQVEADIDQDGSVNFLDISPFISLLAS